MNSSSAQWSGQCHHPARQVVGRVNPSKVSSGPSRRAVKRCSDPANARGRQQCEAGVPLEALDCALPISRHPAALGVHSVTAVRHRTSITRSDRGPDLTPPCHRRRPPASLRYLHASSPRAHRWSAAFEPAHLGRSALPPGQPAGQSHERRHRVQVDDELGSVALCGGAVVGGNCWAPSRKGRTSSRGSGKTMVEFWPVPSPSSSSVCR